MGGQFGASFAEVTAATADVATPSGISIDHSGSMAFPAVSVVYPVSWVDMPYTPIAQEAQPPTIAHGALRAVTRMVAQMRVADGERRRSRVRRGGLIFRYLVVEGYCELAV